MTKIDITLTRSDGCLSNMEVAGDRVTAPMIDAAEDLIHAIKTGERPLPKNLYAACALAFDTTREDAKKRLMGAMYGAKAEPEPTLIGWTWRAHFNDMHADVRNGKWIQVAQKLSLMLSYAIGHVAKIDEERARKERPAQPRDT